MALPTAQMWSIPNLADSARLVMDANTKANPMAAFANIGAALGTFQDSRAKDFDYRQAIAKAQQDLINQQKALEPEIWLSDPNNAFLLWISYSHIPAIKGNNSPNAIICA